MLSFKLSNTEEYTDNTFGSFIKTISSDFDIALFYSNYVFILRNNADSSFSYIFAKINTKEESYYSCSTIYSDTIDTYKNIGYVFMKKMREVDKTIENIDFPFEKVEIKIFDEFENHFYEPKN